jgi:hypothetical protein
MSLLTSMPESRDSRGGHCGGDMVTCAAERGTQRAWRVGSVVGVALEGRDSCRADIDAK